MGQVGPRRSAQVRRGRHIPARLASLLLVDGPLSALVDAAADLDLARYLVLAHHGKLRLPAREPDQVDPDVLLGLEEGAAWSVLPIFGLPAAELTVSLRQFGLGGAQSWTRAALWLGRLRPLRACLPRDPGQGR